MRKILPLLLIGCLSGCSEFLCSNQTVRSVASPDGKHKAILFMRECGATTDYTTQVSVVAAWWPFHDIGNVFVADAYAGDAQRGSWGGPWAEIEWVSPERLLVTYDVRSRVFKQSGKAHGIEIGYRTIRR